MINPIQRELILSGLRGNVEVSEFQSLKTGDPKKILENTSFSAKKRSLDFFRLEMDATKEGTFKPWKGMICKY